MLKRAGEPIGPASLLTIALGPGFRAGADCHAVVETQRGHWLGRVYWEGGASEDSGLPDAVQGHKGERVIRAPSDGVVRCVVAIGDTVRAGATIAEVGGTQVLAAFEGVVRGLIHDGVVVPKGLKIGDVDPRGVRQHCFSISDKALAVGGGALAAILESRQFHESICPGGYSMPSAENRTGAAS
jgi:xanthine dehydrogenase accessory factor